MKSNCNIKGRKCGGISFAVLLICIGILFLLLNLNVIPIVYKPIILSWQMLLVVIGIWNLFIRHFWNGILLVLIGGFFIYPKLSATFPEQFTYMNVTELWPVLLIGLGVFLIFRLIISPKKGNNCSSTGYSNCKKRNTQGENSSEYLDKNIMFGSSEQIILSQNFKGGDANVMFGELVIDLRKAKLGEGVQYLEANAMFGSIVILVPANWHVELQSSSLLGEFADKRYSRADEGVENQSRLIINGKCMFAGGEVRN